MNIKSLQSSIICVLLILGLYCATLAQNKASTGEGKDEILRVDTDLVSLEVNIKTKNNGGPSKPLKIEDFVVYEDGVRQKISNFSTMDMPFNVVILIDSSGSTSEEIGIMRKAIRRFLDKIRPQDQVAIVEFNDTISLHQDFTTDKNSIYAALDRLKPGRGTSFYDALQLTVEEVLKKIKGRNAVIALTDGVDSYGLTTYDELLPLVERSKTTLYFLEVDTEARAEQGMIRDCHDEKRFEFSEKQLKKYVQEYAEGMDSSEFEDYCRLSRLEKLQINRRLYQSARRELRELAEKTGGHVYPVKQLRLLDPVYEEIARELRTQYSIGYYPTNEKHDGTWRRVKVEIKVPGFEATTRPGYRAPGKESAPER